MHSNAPGTSPLFQSALLAVLLGAAGAAPSEAGAQTAPETQPLEEAWYAVEPIPSTPSDDVPDPRMSFEIEAGTGFLSSRGAGYFGMARIGLHLFGSNTLNRFEFGLSALYGSRQRIRGEREPWFMFGPYLSVQRILVPNEHAELYVLGEFYLGAGGVASESSSGADASLHVGGAIGLGVRVAAGGLRIGFTVRARRLRDTIGETPYSYSGNAFGTAPFINTISLGVSLRRQPPLENRQDHHGAPQY